MIAQIDIARKEIGDAVLLSDTSFRIEKSEKVAIIGNNGTGKTTLLGMLVGSATDYDGELTVKKGASVLWAQQEHTGLSTITAREYIKQGLPHFSHLSGVIEGYALNPEKFSLHAYSDAIESFASNGYFEIDSTIERARADYQLDSKCLDKPMEALSGGQKRLVELIKLTISAGDLLIMDEPTNHMDYIAKQAFVDWLTSTKSAVLVVSHDRDVLHNVDRIVELRDKKLHTYTGNYDSYLRTHSIKMSGAVNQHEVDERRKERLKDDIVRYQRFKERARDPGTIQRFKRLEEKARSEYAELAIREKPTFWIDQEATASLGLKQRQQYEKYKSRTIKIHTKHSDTITSQPLLIVDDVSLGYDTPLFSDVTFRLLKGEKVRVVGRNGAGKTTLFEAIIRTAHGQKPASNVYAGYIELHREARIGVYEQEVKHDLLLVTLGEAVEQILREIGAPVSEQLAKAELSKYLFDAHADYDKPVLQLSGGQKARLQLIRMLAHSPNVLLLDEPTNHLDLPSIEELEKALKNFTGSILYISHDSYFAKTIGGAEVVIG